MIHTPAKQREAFTLIEIMIVVAIISILIMIVVPGYRRIRYKVKLNACRQNMKVIYNAAQMYLFENTGSVAPDGSHNESNVFQNKLVKNGYLRSYIKCPSGGDTKNSFYAIYNEKDDNDHPLTLKCVHKNGGDKHGYYNGEFGGI